MSESLITSSSRDKIKARYVVIKLLFHESKHDWPVESSGYRIKCWNYGTIRIGFRAGIQSEIYSLTNFVYLRNISHRLSIEC